MRCNSFERTLAFWGHLVVVFFYLGAGADASTAGRITLQIGESKELQLEEGAELEVSRRGILDLFETKPGLWNITGVRSGFAIVNVRKSDGNVSLRYFFLITPRPKPDKEENASEFADEITQICAREKLKCDAQRAYVSGSISTSETLWELLSICAKVRPACRLGLVYEEGVLETFNSSLSQYIGLNAHIRISDQGRLAIEISCISDGSTKLDEPPDSLVTALSAQFGKDNFHVRCQNYGGEIFAVRSQLRVLNKDQASHLGVDLVSDGAFNPTPRSREAMNAGEIIGEPLVVVRSGSTSKVRSGGEFKALFHEPKKNQSKQMWKKYGMDLEIFLEKLNENKIRMRTDLKLTSPLNASFDILANHEISSDTLIGLNQRSLVAMTELETKNNGHRSDFSFGNIPILGPLFRINAQDHGKHVLMFWVEVRKDLSEFDVNLDQPMLVNPSRSETEPFVPRSDLREEPVSDQIPSQHLSRHQ